MQDPYDLQRFVDAQSSTFTRAMQELYNGRKRTHWMWFIFPQVIGLGSSEMAQRYAICCREEALAYLLHPLLGPRLEQAAELVLQLQGHTALEIFGAPDNLKLHSSMTLFASVAPERTVFNQVLEAFFEGQPDRQTLARLGA